ncbi:hypothetical protein ADIS_2861 [Lunatimonas lonarensis]|uniref:DUF4136 domain-containing protein n=1 Tax=Lunatimonas lonarensis TaxID=1232681 RepID=R7ZQL1_9BACT|nr:DUF4136 domain-containing protein [Lunatimonas lonarensis]EON76411.1 hypothetical protein ADIS_2861 [Lunatimonas lonarensis]
MRHVNYFILVSLIFCSACLSQRDFVAEYDYNYRGAFKKYKTFGFVEEEAKGDNALGDIIEKTISTRLGSQGFRMKDNNPDLLVIYKLYQSEVRYRGYNQPDFDYWLKKQGIELLEDEADSVAREKMRENYNAVKYTQNDGMLVILVIDHKKGNTVWQGYTNAFFDYDSPNINIDLTRATYKVMDQFKILTTQN